MECLEFQQKINPFLDGRMSIEDTARFIAHADGCPECMEELELRYMVQVGIFGQGQEESGQQGDYSDQVRHILERTRRANRRRYTCRIVKYSVSTAVLWSVLLLMLVQLRVWLIG